MNLILSNEFKNVMKQKFEILHFIISLSLMAVLVYGMFLLSFILGWLCCLESSSSLNMFSSFTIFGIFTIDLIILLLILISVYRYSKLKGRIDYCKSYLIIGLILIIACLIIIPLGLIHNTNLS